MQQDASPEKKQLLKDYGYRFGQMRVRTMGHIGLDIFETKRDGCRSTDIDGKEFLDALSLQGVFNLGRRHPKIVEALQKGLEYLDMGNNFFMSKEKLQFVEKLTATTPGNINCAFLNSTGSESVDLAIKIARGYTSRPNIISANECYHGITGFALSTNGNTDYTKPFEPLMPGFSRVEYGNIDALRKAITPETAAVIFEPMISEAGLLIPPKDYFAKVRDICTTNETLLIIDEVVTGLGRTGKFWGIEHFDGVVPDIMIAGKGLSSGMYPMAATMYTEEVSEFFLTYPFCHYSSTSGSDLGCVAASAMLDIVNNPHFLNEVNRKGKILRSGYEQLKKKYPKTIESYEQIGLNTVVRLSDDSGGFRMNSYLANEGIFVLLSTNKTSVIRIQPPLIIADEDLQVILEALDKALFKFETNK